MNVRFEDKGPILRKLLVELDAQTVNEKIFMVYCSLADKVDIKGFRKGKASAKVLQGLYGEVLEKEIIDSLVNDSLYPAIIETDTRCVAEPDRFEYGLLQKDQPFNYSVELETMPQIDPKDYNGLKLRRKIYTPDEKSLAEQFQLFLDQQSRLVPTKRINARLDDTVTIDYHGTKNGKGLEGVGEKGFKLTLGSQIFVPGFEEQLIGMTRGQEKEFELDFPNDHPTRNLAGQSIRFKVILREIEETVMATLDESFAKDMGYHSVMSLKQAFTEDICAYGQEQVDGDLRQALIEQLIERNDFDVPEGMIKQMLRQINSEQNRLPASQGMTLDQMGMPEDVFNRRYRAEAEMRVKGSLLLEAIARKEKIHVPRHEFEARLTELAESEKISLGMINSEHKQNFLAQMFNEKTIAFLIEQADLTEIKVQTVT